MVEELKVFCIIYIVTVRVIHFSGNSKIIHNWKQKLIIWTEMSLPLKLIFFKIFISDIFELLFTFIHLCLACLSVLFKSLSFVNLHLFLHDVSIFWLEHLYILSKLQIPALKVHLLWCRTLIYRWKLSEKVSLMFEDSFPIPLLCNLMYISLYLSITAWKASAIFLKLILGVLARSVNFEIPKRFLCRWPVFPVNLSVSYDYGLKN